MSHSIVEIKAAGQKARQLQKVLDVKNQEVQDARDAYTEDDVAFVAIDKTCDAEQNIGLGFEISEYPSFRLVCRDDDDDDGGVDISLAQMAELHKIFGAILGKK